MECLHSALMINDLSRVSSWSLLPSENEDGDRGEPRMYLLHPGGNQRDDRVITMGEFSI